MATMTPIAVRLVPDLLRARGVAAGLKELTAALALGAVPGRRERGRWLLSEADLDAAERYFRERTARGAWRGGAAGRHGGVGAGARGGRRGRALVAGRGALVLHVPVALRVTAAVRRPRSSGLA